MTAQEKLPTVALGTGGPQVGVQGLGCMGMSEFYGPSDVEESLKTLDRALELGVTLFDTADAPHYGGIKTCPAYIRRAVEPSLRRLGIDTIDLYYAHRRDPNVPIEDMMGALAELVEQGKIRQIGLSEVTGDELRAAHAVHP